MKTGLEARVSRTLAGMAYPTRSRSEGLRFEFEVFGASQSEEGDDQRIE